MVRLTARAARQVQALRDHYDGKGRPEAAVNLARALARAVERIGTAPEAGLVTPRPYPGLAQDGRRWVKEGRYWFQYSLATQPVIIAVLFEMADLPNRL